MCIYSLIHKKSSKEIAKERLKSLLKKDRRNCSENYWDYLLKPTIPSEKTDV